MFQMEIALYENLYTINTAETEHRMKRVPLHLGCISIKVDRDAVDTMPLVGRGVESLTFEHMPQVASAVLASDFDPLHAPAPIRVSVNGARDRIEECRPSTTAVELG